MRSDNQKYRYGTIKHPYTKLERIKIWFLGIVEAIKIPPDTHWDQWILLKPGDPGYEDASWVVEEHPTRYRFENGEWIQVDPNEAPKAVNPDWHSP